MKVDMEWKYDNNDIPLKVGITVTRNVLIKILNTSS
jgi:hypothetical protein